MEFRYRPAVIGHNLRSMIPGKDFPHGSILESLVLGLKSYTFWNAVIGISTCLFRHRRSGLAHMQLEPRLRSAPPDGKQPKF